ncbi:lyase [Edwardsiella hoshinae]|uniref:Lyase n=1 Tax=Edwardsiella hoshinae TaxID=93378 RepID=A0A376DL59_9GAMM|nr:VOC family protein [Edwardsiella hoshinae]AOV97734.1 lyase [Edwardsiella hoshinae]QPR29383.1 VOC family protein [Edwardsiella hoshinae]STC90644.1 putative lyase [Edwardsiella hoshinae]
MKLNRIHHIAVIASDYARSKAFYCKILGFSLIHEQYRADRDSWKGDLALDGVYTLELFSFPSPPPRVSTPEACGLRHLAFGVSDLAAAVAELTAQGVACEAVRRDAYSGRDFTFFRDPDGLPLELYQD